MKRALRQAEDEIKQAAERSRTGTDCAGRTSASRWKSCTARPSGWKAVAKFVVEHWEKRRAAMEGKAMIVTMSRDIAARLYDEIASSARRGTRKTTTMAR